ncbi:MAG: phosphoribosylformylglycinamidine synthase [Blastocatellia bacterium]
MKANIYVTLKPGVLDPQGKAIQHSAEMLGFESIDEIRQGKFFEVFFKGGLSLDDARLLAEKLGSEILANPVIENYRVDIVE